MSMAVSTCRVSDTGRTPGFLRNPVSSCLLTVLLTTGAPAQAPLVLDLEDYATVPVTGSATGTGNSGSFARVNVLRDEPGGGRLFVADLNGPLYILDKQTRAFTVYLDFNGRDGRTGLFDKLAFAAGLANGLITFQFDPEYRLNGKLYTIHLEETGAPGSLVPDPSSVPGLKVAGYTPTPPIRTPGSIDRHAVVIEWTDTDVSNATFEGTARELMRVEHNTRIHPMGDLIFNPTAPPGDADWGVLYIGCGDGGSGELRNEMRANPQRLDTLVGKILRVIPDLSRHRSTSDVSDNGRYRIPRENPFVAVPGARGEIWAVGLRNPHRLAWDVDPANPARPHLLVSNIGLGAWETVHIVRRGANHGYSEREGNQRMTDANQMVDLPVPDEIPVRVNAVETRGTVTPTYPVIQYPHSGLGGDAIAGGFVYRGARLPRLQGKFIFGDVSTGKIWYSDFDEMLKADDRNPATVAPFHEVQLRWTPPGGAARHVYQTMFPVVLAGYQARGGADPDMPGGARVSGTGRADIRFAVDAAGELYILSKSDGMIRQVMGTN
jgi:glucose/arabinose dehydrogenase